MTHAKASFNEIRDFIVDLIQQRRQAGCMEMPSENQLADYFAVSRSLIRAVYQQLVDLGYLESSQGKGYYLKACLPSVNLLLRGDQSFSQKMKELGYDYQARVLPIEEDDEGYYFARLRLINHIPVALHQSYLPRHIFPHFIDEIGQETSLFNYLHSKGYHHFNSTKRVLSVQIPNQKLSHLLECTSLTSLVVLQTNCLDRVSQQELETSTIYYRSDIVTFQMQT
ncbi:GntR family transcriptional regulator [Vaginisenegalia massiliensis]|uniref:GntR family transcriptional regulator n=1 Tax=Vaginisenegalia massiliensis TaxID=2058294 RepID=UPI0013DDEA3D|nr:GntR family transcriptional regulator [Vaginisenegalia massiliensis]